MLFCPANDERHRWITEVPDGVTVYPEEFSYGLHTEAEGLFREALSLRRRSLSAEHPNVDNSLSWLAKTLTDQGKHDEAEVICRERLLVLRKQPANPKVASALGEFTECLLAQEKFHEAETQARECLALCEKITPDDSLTFTARTLLGGSLLGQKKYAESEPLLLSGYSGMKQREDRMRAIQKPRLRESVERLVQLYEATDREQEAAEWKKKLTELDKAKQAKEIVAPKP